MIDKNHIKNTADGEKSACRAPLNIVQSYDQIDERTASGNAPVSIEIICERVHCVLYDYAINTVDMVVQQYGDQVDIQTVVRQGCRKNAKRFIELCEIAGEMLAVPAILINGEVVFSSVPHPDELKYVIEVILEKKS